MARLKEFKDLKNRAILSTILVAFVTLLIIFSHYPLFQFIIMILLVMVGVLGLFEYMNLLSKKDIHLPRGFLSVTAGLFIFANYLTIVNASFSVIVGIVVAAFFFGIFLYNFIKVEGAIINVATSFFGSLYVILPLELMLRILYPYSIPCRFQDGRLWIAYLIAVTKITDMGGYFIGRMWGEKKLAPHLSPGKTIIGAIGGFVSAVILSVIFYLISLYYKSSLFEIAFWEAIVMGGVIGVFGQLGDLAESLLKRDAKVKDSNVIPIVGVLDMVDSLLFTAPIVYLFLKACG